MMNATPFYRTKSQRSVHLPGLGHTRNKKVVRGSSCYPFSFASCIEKVDYKETSGKADIIERSDSNDDLTLMQRTAMLRQSERFIEKGQKLIQENVKLLEHFAKCINDHDPALMSKSKTGKEENEEESVKDDPLIGMDVFSINRSERAQKLRSLLELQKKLIGNDSEDKRKRDEGNGYEEDDEVASIGSYFSFSHGIEHRKENPMLVPVEDTESNEDDENDDFFANCRTIIEPTRVSFAAVSEVAAPSTLDEENDDDVLNSEPIIIQSCEGNSFATAKSGLKRNKVKSSSTEEEIRAVRPLKEKKICEGSVKNQMSPVQKLSKSHGNMLNTANFLEYDAPNQVSPISTFPRRQAIPKMHASMPSPFGLFYFDYCNPMVGAAPGSHHFMNNKVMIPMMNQPATRYPFVQRKKETRGRKKKVQGMPNRPLSSYNFFFQKERKRIHEKDPSIGYKEMARIVSQRWRTLSDEEKKPLKEEADKDLIRYKKAMEEYYKKHPEQAPKGTSA